MIWSDKGTADREFAPLSYLVSLICTTVISWGAEELEFPGTVVSVPGRHSYPNGFGPNKALKYIDLRMMAETAEEEGVDFRVLYMRRPVTDIIIANTIHRDFQT